MRRRVITAKPLVHRPHLDATSWRTLLSDSNRRASVLLLVVVVVSMLTLIAYSFAQMMMTELEAASMHTHDVQARATADSGIEFVATLLGNRATVGAENLVHNPQSLMGQVVSPSPMLRANSRFSIIAPVEHDTKSNAIRYGLMDESAKLNLNALPNMGLSHDDITKLLMNVPNMTTDIVDCILDWMDSDDTLNPYGAESETYQQKNPPYKAKNGPFETIDELLLVKGITPALLYGEDANRNGLLDPNENDGEISAPLDNADGVLNHGFIAYFSVHGRESNRRADGHLKINVNDGFLTDLYDALAEAFDEDTAKFVITYRINGPSGKKTASTTNPLPTDAASGSGSQSSGTSSSGSGSGSAGSGSGSPGSSGSGSGSTKSSGSSSSKSSGTGGSNSSATSSAAGAPNATSGTSPASSPDPQSTADKEAAQGMKDFLSFVTSSGGKVTRGGIDLSKGGPTTIDSLWQLIGSTTQGQIEGANKTLTSPWASDASSIVSIMPDLMDKLTTTTDEYLEGRINVNQARREILLGIPSMTEEIVNGIVAAQQLDSSGQPSVDALRQHNTTAWLYAQGLVDLPGMVNLDPYITSHGDIYKVQSLGFFDGGGPVARVEAMIDATQLPPRVILNRDLNELGRGYSRLQLLPVRQ